MKRIVLVSLLLAPALGACMSEAQTARPASLTLSGVGWGKQVALHGVTLPMLLLTVALSGVGLALTVQAAVDAGAMRPILVIGLGTNGWIDEETLDEVHAMLPRGTRMIVVNVQVPREWGPDVNSILDGFARKERDVELSNWYSAIQPQIDVLADDEVHPGPTGGLIYCSALADALQRLSEIPPLLGSNDYGLANLPV